MRVRSWLINIACVLVSLPHLVEAGREDTDGELNRASRALVWQQVDQEPKGQTNWLRGEEKEPRQLFRKEMEIVQRRVLVLDLETALKLLGSGDLFPLVLPSGEEVSFALEKSEVLPPILQNKYPQILTYTGESVNFPRKLTAQVDYSPAKGLRALILDGGIEFYVDPLSMGKNSHDNSTGQYYHTYSAKLQRPEHGHHDGEQYLGTREKWTCGVHPNAYHGSINGNSHSHHEVDDDGDDHQKRLLTHNTVKVPTPKGLSSNAMEYRFTIALIANGQYSKFHGNTLESVLSELATLMNRVNGIYKRELGVHFQLHEQTDDLICLDPCNELSNSVDIFDETNQYIYSKGVSTSSFEIGHTLTTGSGGLAYVGVLCDDTYKALGTTGLSSPTTDAFFVDYVSHELGHQLGGDHTYGDCSRYNDYKSDTTAVEPGSGSTILGYAGICGTDNIQSYSDPYFHSITLEQMSTYVESASAQSCGRRVEKTKRPVVDLPNTCVFPISTPFNIRFGSPNVNYFYALEPVDQLTTFEYTDRAQARFRSWVPTSRPYRNFPNMFYLANDELTYDEILPSGATNMTMRGVIRDYFSYDGTEIDYNNSTGFGTWNFKDVKLSFVAEAGPLIFTDTIAAQVMEAGEMVQFQWEVAGTNTLSATVEILVSLDELVLTSSETLTDYSSQLKEHKWVSLGVTENDGSASLQLPVSIPGWNKVEQVHFMIRSTGSDYCYFFDILPFKSVDYRSNTATLSPTSGASSSPTPNPTPAPSEGLKVNIRVISNATHQVAPLSLTIALMIVVALMW